MASGAWGTGPPKAAWSSGPPKSDAKPPDVSRLAVADKPPSDSERSDRSRTIMTRVKGYKKYLAELDEKQRALAIDEDAVSKLIGARVDRCATGRAR